MKKIIQSLKRSWQSHFWMNLATTAVLSLCFGVILFSFLFATNISKVFALWGEEIQVTLYLKEGLSQQQTQDFETKIKTHEKVAGFKFIDKQMAAQTFEKSLKNYGPHFMTALKGDVGNPFPASFQLQLKADVKSPEKIEEVARYFQQDPIVEDVSYGQEWVTHYAYILKFAKVMGALLSAIILFSCLFTVSNSIQASIQGRRDEIEILELVGATQKNIRNPFIIEGAFQGLLASCFSLVILSLAYIYLVKVVENIMGGTSVSETLSFFSFPLIFLAVILGAGIGAAGSYLCLIKINTGWSAAQRAPQ